MGFLNGKRILVTGVLSNRSIAYGIARACKQQGAELAFTYVGERFKERVTEFAQELGSNIVISCDVAEDQQIENAFKELQDHWDRSEEHTSELQSLMRISYDVFCLKKQKNNQNHQQHNTST